MVRSSAEALTVWLVKVSVALNRMLVIKLGLVPACEAEGCDPDAELQRPCRAELAAVRRKRPDLPG